MKPFAHTPNPSRARTIGFEHAMTDDVRGMDQRQLDEARALIGATKLDIRRTSKREDLSDVWGRLAPLSARVDRINDEEVGRQKGYRGMRWER